MPIDFPNSPTVGQEFTAGAQTWRWDGVSWNVTGPTATGNYLMLEGGTITGSLEVQGGLLVGGPLGVTGPVTLSGQVTLGTAPVAASDAASKAYVDAQRDTRLTQAQGDVRYLRLTGGVIGGAVGISGNLSATGTFGIGGAATIMGQLTLGQTATQPAHAANKAYVDAQRDTRITQDQGDARYLTLTGGTMTGQLNMGNNQVALGLDPTATTHAANKRYVDAQVATRMTQAASDARYLNLTGGKMVGHILMGDYVVYSETDSTNPNGYTRKGYVDAQVSSRLTAAQGDARYLNINSGFASSQIMQGRLNVRGGNGNVTARFYNTDNGVIATLTETGNFLVSGEVTSGLAPTGTSSLTRRDYVDGQVAGRLTQEQGDGRYVLRTTELVTANGLNGGGPIGSGRTISLGTPSSITADSENTVSATSHTHFMSPTSVGLLYLGLALNGRGVMIFARNQDGPDREEGETISGASLRYSGENGGVSTIGGSPGGGTWRCQGRAPRNYSTLWLRIS